MTDTSPGSEVPLAHTDERQDLNPELSAGKIPAQSEKTGVFVWRLGSEPRRMVQEHRAFVSALAHGGE